MGGEPGRNLRNLGEPWEPLRRGPASEPPSGTSTDRLRDLLGVGRTARAAGGRTCTDRVGTFYVPPPAGAAEVGEPLQQAQAAGGLRGRETGRGIPRKSRGVYAVITDFSLEYQRSRRTGTELGKPWTVSAPVPALSARRGRAHTKKRDRPRAQVTVRSMLAPVPASWAAAARERPQLRCMPRCTLIATVPALRCAPRSGHLGDECAAMAYTCARSTRLEHMQALPRKAHAAIPHDRP